MSDEPKRKIKCSKCAAESDLTACIREEPLPSPYSQVMEGVIVCPACVNRLHIYYLSNELRIKQNKLAELVVEWNRDKKYGVAREIKKVREEYSKFFDQEQEKYRLIMEKEHVAES